MTGIQLSKKYFETYGLPMITKDFDDIKDKLAIGLIGPGSECFGFDDEVSKDHDYEPGFIIFLPSEDVISRKRAFDLERAYAKLPDEFEGLKRQKMNPAGGNRHGVFRTEEFFANYSKDRTPLDLIATPDYLLAEATNGVIFFDNYGELTQIQNSIKNPHSDVFKKKLSATLMMMDQDGLYNYERCLAHNEPLAASIVAKDFCVHALRAIFLLNNQYMPYFKWMFRASNQFELYTSLQSSFETILLNTGDVLSSIKKIASTLYTAVCDHYQLQKNESQDLQRIAFQINNSIQNPEIRNLDIFFGL